MAGRLEEVAGLDRGKFKGVERRIGMERANRGWQWGKRGRETIGRQHESPHLTCTDTGLMHPGKERDPCIEAGINCPNAKHWLIADGSQILRRYAANLGRAKIPSFRRQEPQTLDHRGPLLMEGGGSTGR